MKTAVENHTVIHLSGVRSAQICGSDGGVGWRLDRSEGDLGDCGF